MALRLDEGEWTANGSEAPLCLLPLNLAEVWQRLGWGAAPTAGSAVMQLDGDVLRLEEQLSSKLVQVWVRGDVQTPGRCLDPLCKVLGLSPDQLSWVTGDLGPKPWLLVRLDDNDNRVPMWYFREREVADAVVCDYAARGHKQTYEVERGA